MTYMNIRQYKTCGDQSGNPELRGLVPMWVSGSWGPSALSRVRVRVVVAADHLALCRREKDTRSRG